MIHDTDIALVERFATAGDAEAFGEIVNRYGGLVYSICCRILRDQARAQDASQNTFFQLLRNPQKVTESLSGWLHTVATRAAIDVVRQESSRQRREKEYASTKHGEVPTWENVSPHVDEALNKLPEASRVILVDHFLAGKTEKDLAVELGVSQPTVSRRKKKALSELREKLGKKGILVGAGTLGTLLLSAAAEAAPVALLAKLGKMAMLSGWEPPVGADASGKSSAIGGTGIGGNRDSIIATTVVTLAAIAGILGFFDILHLKPSPTGTGRTVIAAEDGNVSREESVNGKDRVFALHRTTTDGTAESDIKGPSHTAQVLKTTDKTIDINNMLDAHQSQIALDLNKSERPDPGATMGDQEVLAVGKGMSTKGAQIGIFTTRGAGVSGSSGKVELDTTLLGDVEEGKRTQWKVLLDETRWNVEFAVTGPLAERQAIRSIPMGYLKHPVVRNAATGLKVKVLVNADGDIEETYVVEETGGRPQWADGAIDCFKKHWRWEKSSSSTRGYVLCRLIQAEASQDPRRKSDRKSERD